MDVHFSDHAKGRLSFRGISKRRVERILLSDTHRYYDVLTHHHIAVEKKAGAKVLIVAYQEVLDSLWVITAHPLSSARISGRVEIGRWVKL